MGYSRALRYAGAIAAVGGLTACGGAQDGPRMWTRDEIADVADDAFPYRDNNTQKTMDLEQRVIDLERSVKTHQAMIDALAKAHDSLVDTVNENATVANRNGRRLEERLN
jgi:Mg2+ and Co2+ transporter CorA